ncbi:MAG TPA: type II TA system antitoxin MqsA family protein [Gemmataceae bacterium]|nr:type II TA system antitoxin MqsA family protein [Gemmataceae bacterium]
MTLPELGAKKPSRCPVCGRAEVEPRTRTERFTYEDGPRVVEVVAENVPVEVCPACGETYSGPAAWSIRDEAICRALGLLTPSQLRELRTGLRLSLAELAGLVGLEERTLAEWESGRAIPNRTADRLLRLLAAQPETIRFLSGLPAPPLLPAG